MDFWFSGESLNFAFSEGIVCVFGMAHKRALFTARASACEIEFEGKNGGVNDTFVGRLQNLRLLSKILKNCWRRTKRTETALFSETDYKNEAILNAKT